MSAHHRAAAVAHLVRAAAALTEPPTVEALAHAELETGLALLEMVHADPDGHALEHALEHAIEQILQVLSRCTGAPCSTK